MTRGILISKGQTSEVFSWGKHEVIKLFYPDVSLENIHKEAKFARLAHDNNIPTAAVGDIVEYKERTGLVFERINGPTLSKVMLTRFWSTNHLLHQFAKLHVCIHSCKELNLPQQRVKIRRMIHNAANTSTAEKDKMLTSLELFPDDSRICHSDFHPGNLILSDRGLVVIDWANATRGNPLIDIATTFFKLRRAIRFAKFKLFRRTIAQPIGKMMGKNYLRKYFQMCSISLEGLELLNSIISVAHRRDYKLSHQQAKVKLTRIYNVYGLEKSEKWLQKATALGVARVEHLHSIAFSLFRKFYPEIAIKYGERALIINPDNRKLNRALAECRKSLNKNHVIN